MKITHAYKKNYAMKIDGKYRTVIFLIMGSCNVQLIQITTQFHVGKRES